MGIDHCRFQSRMSKQLLDLPDIGSRKQEVGCERMSESMGRSMFRDSGSKDCFANCSLKGFLVDMMATDHPTGRVDGNFGGRKEVLPPEFPCGPGIFSSKSFGKIDFSMPESQIFLVGYANSFYLPVEFCRKRKRKKCGSVFVPLRSANHDETGIKVDIFDAEAKKFHQPKTAAVKQADGKGILWIDSFEKALGFGNREYGRESGSTSGPHGFRHFFQVRVKYLAIEQKERIEGLVLGGGADFVNHSEMGQESFNIALGGWSGKTGSTAVREESSGPSEIGFLGSRGIVAKAEQIPEILQHRIFVQSGSRLNDVGFRLAELKSIDTDGINCLLDLPWFEIGSLAEFGQKSIKGLFEVLVPVVFGKDKECPDPPDKVWPLVRRNKIATGEETFKVEKKRFQVAGSHADITFPCLYPIYPIKDITA